MHLLVAWFNGSTTACKLASTGRSLLFDFGVRHSTSNRHLQVANTFNPVQSYGGAISVTNFATSIKATKLMLNTATGSGTGGAIYAIAGVYPLINAPLIISTSVIEGNQVRVCVGGGGVVWRGEGREGSEGRFKQVLMR